MRPRYGLRYGRPTGGACGSACSHMVWPGVSSDTKHCIMAEGRPLCKIWHGRAAIQHRDIAAACCNTVCDTAGRACNTARSVRAAQIESRYKILYRDQGQRQRGCDTALQRAYEGRHGATTRVRTATRQNMPATRPGGGHDTALYAPRNGTQPGSVGCAPYAPNSVLTQCTALSHCLGHCS